MTPSLKTVVNLTVSNLPGQAERIAAKVSVLPEPLPGAPTERIFMSAADSDHRAC